MIPLRAAGVLGRGSSNGPLAVGSSPEPCRVERTPSRLHNFLCRVPYCVIVGCEVWQLKIPTSLKKGEQAQDYYYKIVSPSSLSGLERMG